MEQIIYTSVAADDLDAGDIFKIVETASRNNVGRDVTGLLIFVRGRFFQLVEGPTVELDRLLGDVSEDRRHHSINILKRCPIEVRRFSRWRMRRVLAGEGHRAWDEFNRLLATNSDPESILDGFDQLLRERKFAA